MSVFLVHIGSVSSTTATSEESNFLVQNKLICDGVNNQSYTCESGHCCGQSQCCSYYYELWCYQPPDSLRLLSYTCIGKLSLSINGEAQSSPRFVEKYKLQNLNGFWLVWAVIFILSCCCVCHHRRTKHRQQQQQRQHEINLIAYREAHNYTSVPFYFRFLPNYLLPEYEEVVNRPPTPPPPYSALTSSQSAASSPLTTEQPDGLQQSPQTTPVPPDCNNVSPEHGAGDAEFPTCYIQKEAHKAQLEIRHCVSCQPVVPVRELPGPEKQEGDLCKELLRDLTSKVWLEEEEEEHEGKGAGEERSAGRRRHVTGDSGIEVCVCGPVQECETLQELSELLGDGPEPPVDFCDGCTTCDHRAPPGREGRGPGLAERRAEPQEPPSVCLVLHTISEQDGPKPSLNAEPQR